MVSVPFAINFRMWSWKMWPLHWKLFQQTHWKGRLRNGKGRLEKTHWKGSLGNGKGRLEINWEEDWETGKGKLEINWQGGGGFLWEIGGLGYN